MYILYKDGEHYPLLLDKSVKIKPIKAVGIVHGRHAFGVCLHDATKEKIPLLREDAKYDVELAPYKIREADAFNDWNAELNTKQLVEKGTDIPLEEGQFIPSLAMLAAMAYYKDKLNVALDYLGGEPLKDDYYWSSSENSINDSWSVHFDLGIVGYWNNQCNTPYVRPCTAF